MLVTIDDVLSADAVRTYREALAEADWIDGRATAGAQSGAVKHNLQVEEGSPCAQRLGERVLDALSRSPTFLAAAMPLRIFPPLFNCYREGQRFDSHVDNAVRRVPGTAVRIRTDLSCTLFLSDPDSYVGGELLIEDASAERQFKLPAGSLILYPSTSVHRVAPITRGERLACFFWLQSMVKDNAARQLLFDLDQAIQDLSAERGINDAVCVRLSAIYHNLTRRWSEI